MRLHVCQDLEEGARIWQMLQPALNVFDCWEVRLSFHKAFGWPLCFIVADISDRPVGFVPLSWIDEEGYYGYFPGEIWQGRTWLEQNCIPAMSDGIRKAMWEAIPENTELRYLRKDSISSLAGTTVDEVGYVFHPQCFNYDYYTYLSVFKGKRRKQLLREVGKLESMGCRYHTDKWDDIYWMFEMNLSSFDRRSYFSDYRFLRGFEDMLSFLAEQKTLRVTTVLIKGQRAAVDVGAVYGNCYTVLAGATSPEFPGIAKVINLFHLKWGCESRFSQIDFLCGDFGWKSRFHLQPRPLYLLNKSKEASKDLNFSSGRRSNFESI